MNLPRIARRLAGNKSRFVAMLGSLALLAFSGAASAAAQNLSPSYSQNFNALASSGTSNPWSDDSTLSGWYATCSGGSSCTGITAYRASTGSDNAGALYSFGTAASDRALGSLASNGWGGTYYAVRLVNNSGSTLTGISVAYTGEQWRNGGNTTAQKLAFSYQVGATGITAGTWTAVSALDFIGPVATATAAALDGNVSANRTALSATVNVSLAPGQEIWLRWYDANDSGNDHGLAIDDLTVTPVGAVDTAPSVTATTPAGSATNVAVNSNVTVTFSEPVTAAANAFGISCVTSGMHTFVLSNSASTTFTLNPDTDFANGEACTVTVSAASVTDQDGTADHMAADYSFSFTTVPAVTGACGSDNRQPLAATPTHLCTTGSPSAVSGAGPWTWSCVGSAGSATAYCGAPLAGTDSGFSILHVNDTHARLTPHKWQIPGKSATDGPYEDVGGAAYAAGKMLSLAAQRPTNSLVIDAGDISEGNPVGDYAGSTADLTVGGYTLKGCYSVAAASNCGMTQFYQLLNRELLAQRGRGMDAVVVGNHDVRDLAYIKNLEALRDSGVPVLSVNVRDIATHQTHFAPYTVVTLNGLRVGILGYTTQASEVGASLAGTLEVVDCDWSAATNTTGTTTTCHLSDYVNELRAAPNNADVVVLVAHIGHGALVDQNPSVGPNLLVDDGVNKLPEVVVTGHWHTWAETVWQPMELNYKSIFTESASYLKYIGQLDVTAAGKYQSATQHVLQNATITPDANAQTLVNTLIAQYDAAHAIKVNQVVGYTNDNLVLDNDMRWWSPDEYPWSGNNSAGQWITDAMQWKCAQLFGSCDLAVEAGGGVRSDIPAGPVTLLQVYETFPWNDDTFVRVDMNGQDIINFLKETNMDAGFSSALHVTAKDGVPTAVTVNGQPIDLNKIYTVAINNYMLAHPPTGYTWPTHSTPLQDSTLVRDGIIDFMQTVHPDAAHGYSVGGPRYDLTDNEFSGGYRAVVTMMDDHDTRPTFDAAFVRFLSATPDTLARRGNNQVPAGLVNADGSINAANRLSSMEIYRSHLGFKPGALVPGDIVEFWGKASFYGGGPEFVDQEGIVADGVEFKIVGHDASLAKPEYMSSIGAFFTDDYKNRYVKFRARKSATTATVTDQNNVSLLIKDKTGYANATLPGATNDVLEITGVVTMESYGLRFRMDSASVVSGGSLPAASTVSSHVDGQNGIATGAVTLTATAAVTGGGYSLTPVADAQVESGSSYANSNFGSKTYMYVQSSSVSSFGNERAWLRFDLSSIPAGTTITGATLKLWNYASAGAALPVEVHGVIDDSWSESGLTWNNQPTLGAVLDTKTLAAGASNVWYGWDVGSFVQSQYAGDKLVSLMAKAVSEGSSDTAAPSYAFDAKEYGSNAPVLYVTTSTTPTAVASVRFFYRYSADNSTWGAWTLLATDSAAPFTAAMTFPQSYGYYEFYSVATDDQGNVEPAPVAAQTSVHYQAASGQAQTIGFGQPADMQVGSSATLPTATASSGLSVIFSSLTSAVCTVSGTQVTTVATGVCTVAADQPGGGIFAPAAQVTRSFSVSKLTQTITFAALANQPVNTAPFAVTATASSGLPVTIASQTTGVCTISNDMVTLIAAGTCTLAASQPGDATYAAAPVVMESFQVTAAGGTGADGDVPLPAWALIMLGAGLFGAVRGSARARR